MKRGRPKKNHFCLPSAAYAPLIPDLPSAWELLIKGRSVDEAIKDQRVREWVHSHCRSKFVPEKVLERLGIPVD